MYKPFPSVISSSNGLLTTEPIYHLFTLGLSKYQLETVTKSSKFCSYGIVIKLSSVGSVIKSLTTSELLVPEHIVQTLTWYLVYESSPVRV